jgi:hypothetical protein
VLLSEIEITGFQTSGHRARQLSAQSFGDAVRRQDRLPQADGPPTAEVAIEANPSGSGDTLLYLVTVATLAIAIAAIACGHIGSGLLLMVGWYIGVLPPLVRHREQGT